MFALDKYSLANFANGCTESHNNYLLAANNLILKEPHKVKRI